MRKFLVFLGLLCVVGIVASQRLGAVAKPQAPSSQPPPKPTVTIKVAKPLEGNVADYEEFKGRVETSATVQLRPRVSGYVTKVLFKAGAKVNKGELLFELDPVIYQAKVNEAKAQVQLQQASLAYAKGTLDRFKDLAKKEFGAVSPQQIDQYQAAADQANANLEVAKVQLATAELHLEWTKVTAPMDGTISPALLSPGNVVAADTTVLATIDGSGPMYVSFGVDQARHWLLAKIVAEAKGKADTKDQAGFVAISLADDGDKWDHSGVIDFVGVRVEPDTNKVRWRAVLNAKNAKVLPGWSVRVRVTVRGMHKALLIHPAAVGGTAEQPEVYVVNAKNVVQRRAVKLGQVHDGLQVVTEGLTATDLVVLDGQHPGVLPGEEVSPQLTTMPASGLGAAKKNP